VDNNEVLWHAGLWLFGSNMIEKEAKEGAGEYQNRATQFDLCAEENYSADSAAQWEEMIHNLMCYKLLETIGTHTREGDIKISRNNMLSLCSATAPLNRLWFPKNNQLDTILDSGSENCRNFNLRFKTKGFGYIERENEFVEINKESYELLSAINSSTFLMPNLVFTISCKTMLTLKEKDIAWDLLLQLNFPMEKQIASFIGKKKFLPINIIFGFIIRLLLKEFKWKKIKLWGGVGLELCTDELIASQRSLITEGKIREFIAHYTENNTVSCNVLSDFINKNGRYYSLNIVIVLEQKEANCFLILNIIELFKGIIEIKINCLSNSVLWENSTEYIEEMIIEKNYIEEQDYLAQIYL
jgi:hypothetical protein